MSDIGPIGKKTSHLTDDDHAFLNEIEQNIRDKKDVKAALEKEIDQRGSEMERLREALTKNPNFGQRNLPKNPTPTPSAKSVSASETQRTENISDDPRYREYYERLRKEKNKLSGNAASPAAQEPEAEKRSNSSTPAASSAKSLLKNGDILSFEDGSIGIARNPSLDDSTVMFYFLKETGGLQSEEIFLKYYQFKKIGTIPEYLFAEQRNNAAWNRDMIVFHLGDYDYVQLLNQIKPHKKRSSDEPVSGDDAPSVSPEPQLSHSSEAPAAQGPEENLSSEEKLARGQRIRINFSGKSWEAVCWDEDGADTVLAHQTHGSWALMRLNLDRFEDSLELLTLLTADEISEIENSLIEQNG